MEFNFYRLKIWEKAHFFTLEIYKITKLFPSYKLLWNSFPTKMSIFFYCREYCRGLFKKRQKRVYSISISSSSLFGEGYLFFNLIQRFKISFG